MKNVGFQLESLSNELFQLFEIKWNKKSYNIKIFGQNWGMTDYERCIYLQGRYHFSPSKTIIVWRLFHNRLPTYDNLLLCGYHIPSMCNLYLRCAISVTFKRNHHSISSFFACCFASSFGADFSI